MIRVISYVLCSMFIMSAHITAQQVNFGGAGEYKIHSMQPLTQAQRDVIMKANLESARRLKELGIIPQRGSAAEAVPQFGFPLAAVNGLQDAGFHGISGFVDHDNLYPDHLLDYNGGTRTYDLSSGYNHAGTDFFSWPFPWYRKLNNQVAVVAADSGIIIGKADGNFDDNCAMGSGDWNAVYVMNWNNVMCWYGHMKKNSLTAKPVGSSVARGEYLGIVGSSGSSTGPHLHFEVYDANNNLIDPFYGQSNPSITSSWWQNQLPYYNSAVNSLMTHNAAPVFPSCPGVESVNAQDEFLPGSKIYFGAYYRDQLRNQTSVYTIYKPDGSIFAQWDATMTEVYWAASWWYWWVQFPTALQLGRWTFEDVYNNTTYRHYFDIKSQLGTEIVQNNIAGQYHLSDCYPNPFNPDTKFTFSVPVNSYVVIEVYNSLGKLVKTLENSVFSHGAYMISFNAAGLPSGVYFCTLRARAVNSGAVNLITNKFVLLK